MKGAFLVNASRSGSTMMSTILRHHPDVLSLSELMTNQGPRALLPGRVSGEKYWDQLARPTALMRQLANPESAPSEFLYHTIANRQFDPFNCPPILAVTLPHLFEAPDVAFHDLASRIPRLPLQTRADHLRAVIGILARKTGRQVWVERSGGTLCATSALATGFPEARFAVILRDGRDVVLSMQNYKPARFLIWFWKLARRCGIDVFRPGAQIGSAPWIALTEKLAGRMVPVDRIINTRPSIPDTAACWSALTISGLGQLAKLSAKRRMVLRYEQVIAAPRQELSRFAEFLDLSQNSDWLSYGASVPRAFAPRHLSLPSSQQQELNALTAAARDVSDRFA